MTDQFSDLGFDFVRSSEPATKFELWQSMVLLRRQVLQLQILMLTIEKGTAEDRVNAQQAIKKTGDDIDKFTDALIGAKDNA